MSYLRHSSGGRKLVHPLSNFLVSAPSQFQIFHNPFVVLKRLKISKLLKKFFVVLFRCALGGLRARNLKIRKISKNSFENAPSQAPLKLPNQPVFLETVNIHTVEVGKFGGQRKSLHVLEVDLNNSMRVYNIGKHFRTLVQYYNICLC